MELECDMVVCLSVKGNFGYKTAAIGRFSPLSSIAKTYSFARRSTTFRGCMSRPICAHFTKPGGCYKGDKCRFLHPSPAAPVASGNSPSTSSKGPRKPQGPFFSFQIFIWFWSLVNVKLSSAAPKPHVPPPRAPGNVCNYFWSGGSCVNGFACRFQHTLNPALQNSSSNPAGSPSAGAPITPESIAAFLTQGGMEKLSGSSSDGLFSAGSTTFTFTETNNYLRRYLFADFRFKGAPEMSTFINLLSNATSENSSWVWSLD